MTSEPIKLYRKPGRPRKHATVGRAEGTAVINYHTAQLLLKMASVNGWQMCPYTLREANELHALGLILVHFNRPQSVEDIAARISPHGYAELAKWFALQSEAFYSTVE